MSQEQVYSFDLSGAAVHVWPLLLRGPAAGAVAADAFEELLSPDERERAARFHLDHLRRSFAIARGALRILLGRYLNTSPESIRFTYGPKGKPSLGGPARLEFNASHSGDLGLFAFTRYGEIGVDVEHIRPMPDLAQLASRFFCAEESADLMALPADRRETAFFLCWTRKEAFIKATGDGLSTPLDSFRVGLDPGARARIVHLGGDTDAALAWSLHDLKPAEGYAAALAYRDTKRPLRMYPLLDPIRLLDFR